MLTSEVTTALAKWLTGREASVMSARSALLVSSRQMRHLAAVHQQHKSNLDRGDHDCYHSQRNFL
jgi:hypothetical protein